MLHLTALHAPAQRTLVIGYVASPELHGAQSHGDGALRLHGTYCTFSFSTMNLSRVRGGEPTNEPPVPTCWNVDESPDAACAKERGAYLSQRRSCSIGESAGLSGCERVSVRLRCEAQVSPAVDGCVSEHHGISRGHQWESNGGRVEFECCAWLLGAQRVTHSGCWARTWADRTTQTSVIRERLGRAALAGLENGCSRHRGHLLHKIHLRAGRGG